MTNLSDTLVLYLAVMILFIGCQSDNAEIKDKEHKYFDLEGLVKNQIALLDQNKPTIRKIAVIDGEEESIESNALNWEKEFVMFMESDINKSKLLMQYDTEQFTSDAGDEIIKYTNVDETGTGVVSMEIVKKGKNDKIKVVTIEKCEYNTLYASKLQLEMQFNNDQSNLLSSYSVKGFEKIILKDSLKIEIHGEIL